MKSPEATSELLVELFSEEIPARMQLAAAAQLKNETEKKFTEQGLNFGSAESFVTPRRLCLVVHEVAANIAGRTVEKRGPRLNAPQAALDGFLKSTGLKIEQLEKRDDFYFAVIKEESKAAEEVIKKSLQEVIENFAWPKSMKWGNGQKTWVRPLQNILCVFNEKIINLSFAGVNSNNKTFGHRFLSGKEFSVKNFSDYKQKLRENFVILDHAERQKIITEQAEKIAAAKNLKLKRDERLLEEVGGLVEFPVVLSGEIDKEFMQVPGEVLSTSMKAHQKYFSLFSADGSLAPYFIVVSNMQAEDAGKQIVAGNARVLRARLSDAKFFWEQDLRKDFAGLKDKLKTVTFHAKLGSYYDKTSRMVQIIQHIARVMQIDVNSAMSAADLCKADLVSEMVGEFPELQGIMGGYYAAKSGFNPEICQAIREHYYYPPVYSNAGEVSKSKLSVALAIADKIDTLSGMFAIGEEPTGSKDPFALRRATLNIIEIILQAEIKNFSLRDLINRALEVHKKSDEKTAQKIHQFFVERLKHQLKSQIRHDYIDAVLDAKEDDLLKIKNKAEALQEFLNSPDGKNLLAAYKRAANIIAAEEKKDKTSYTSKIFDKNLAAATEEKKLAEALEKTANSGIEQLFEIWKFTEVMLKLSTLRAPLDSFFDKVIVNSDDKKLKENRLALLYSVKNLCHRIADFSKIEG